MTHDKRRTVQLLDYIRHGKRFSASRHTQQHLRFRAGFHTFYQRLYRLRLVSCWFIWTLKFKQNSFWVSYD